MWPIKLVEHMKLSQFRFDLPLNLIAQNPTKRREDARMMVVHRKTGNIENKQQFMAALKTVQINNDPLGKFKLDALGNPVMDVYIRKVQQVNGKLSNTVIKTYPNVTQFWTYKTSDFLANPVYSRDYPPANNLEK